MGSVKHFEDLVTWQEARALVKEVYRMSETGKFAKDFGLRDQIQRAAVSIMANIAVGFDSDTTAEYLRFLGYARRSASEVQSLLYVAIDTDKIPQSAFQTLYTQCDHIKALLGGLTKSLRRRQNAER
jgi:four helix bundle protein